MTFDHPPINTISATTVAEVAELVDLIEQDVDLSVVVFDSANADFYLAHYDGEDDPRRTEALPAGPTGRPAWTDVLGRLALARVATIASIRGRACCAGTEFIVRLRPAIRLAREHAARPVRGWQRHVPAEGRAGPAFAPRRHRPSPRDAPRWDDLDEARAEKYGYVNRLIADDQLDGEVDRIASRVARLDRDAMRRTRSYFEQATLREP